MKAATISVILATALPSPAPAQTFAPAAPISAIPAGKIRLADLDGDGDRDVLWSSYSWSVVDPQLAWSKNSGGNGFTSGGIFVLGTDFDPSLFPSDMLSADLDGDGDMDVVATFQYSVPHGAGVVWYENLGGGLFEREQLVGMYGNGESVVGVGDLDGDGDNDIVSANGSYPSGLLWYENLGGGSFNGRQVIASGAGYSVQANDLDGDGDSDLLFTSATGGGLRWIESLGAGVFGPEQVIAQASAGISAIQVLDLDGDGNRDIVGNSAGQGAVVWIPNLGAQVFDVPHVVSAAGSVRGNDYLGDFDSDGDEDIAMVMSPTELVWLENLGAGAFGTVHPIALTAETIRALVIADIDNDGDPDAAATQVGDQTVWFENIGSDCNRNGVDDALDLASGSETDCDSDGVLDSCQRLADATYDLNTNGVFDPCEAIGASYCSPAVANSTGLGASLTALGSELLFFSDVTLTARGLPQNSFGMFVASQTQGFAFPIPSSQGALCVLGLVGRYNQPGQIMGSGASGSLVFPIDLMAIPTPNGFTQALPGETWNFQAWYRDNNPASTSNFTDAVSITFQ